jgi:rod shape-determining protein MreC
MAAYQDDFFTRGPSPLARVTFFGLLAMLVMVADHRFEALGAVRTAVATVLSPVERALMWPGKVVSSASDYVVAQDRLIAENRALNEKVLALAADGQRAALIAAEQSQVDALRAAHTRFQRDGVVAEIIRDARNPFARKVVLNRGVAHGIKPGSAVIDGDGVVGQVTAVGANSAEVTLTTEKDQSVPVMVIRPVVRAAQRETASDPARATAAPSDTLSAPSGTTGAAVPEAGADTIAAGAASAPTLPSAPNPNGTLSGATVTQSGLRAVAVGSGRDGTIELPFIPVAADIQVGDKLVTSGIDGTYPAGLFVGTVTVVDKNPGFSFARIVAQPSSAPDHHRFVKVLIQGDAQQSYPRADSGVGDKPQDKSQSRRDAKLEAKRALREHR